MNEKLSEALQRAGELTRTGRLGEATAAIQQVLSRRLPPGLHKGLRTLADPPGQPTANTIDVEAKVIPELHAYRDVRAPQPEPTQVPADDSGLPPPGSFTSHHYRDVAGSRDYKLYRPRVTADDGQTALVVMLHGCTQNPDDFATGTRMNALADARGWWVLYPAQSRSANNSGCWNWFKTDDQRRGSGEPAILAGMTRAVVERAGISPSKVYVAGLSAGGAMAVTLAATYPDLYAAAGVHSGLPHGSAHDLVSALAAMRQGASSGGSIAQAVPTIVFHGDQDTTVHPCNGASVVRQTRGTAPAAAADDAGPYEVERARVPQGHAYTRTLHHGADDRIEAEHWVVHGAGHAWFGGSAAGSYTDPLGPDASAEMLRFFAEVHRKAD